MLKSVDLSDKQKSRRCLEQIESAGKIADEESVFERKLEEFKQLTDQAEHLEKLPPSIKELVTIDRVSEVSNRENFKTAEAVRSFKEDSMAQDRFLHAL